MSTFHEIFFDIETIPSQRADVKDKLNREAQEAIAQIDAELNQAIAQIAPPSNIKDPEKITAWLRDEAPKKRAALDAKAITDRDAANSAAEEKWRRTALDGSLGQIAVIGFALNNEEASTLFITDLGDEAEAELLRSFWRAVSDACRAKRVPTTALRWIGHNSSGFDVRFIFQRSVIRGVQIPQWFMSLVNAKPWDNLRSYDTMIQWAGPRDRISMDNLCFALGIDGKGTGQEAEGLNGSKVWDFVRDGRISEVATYCAGDIHRTRAIYRRIAAVTEPQDCRASLELASA